MFKLIGLIFFAYCPCVGQHSILTEGIHPSLHAKAKTGICQWSGSFCSLNPALLSELHQGTLSAYSRNYYFTKGISNQTVLLQLKLNGHSGSSVMLSRDGSKDFAEYLFKMGYGLILGQNTNMGIGLFGILTDQFGLKNKFYANIQWGILTQVNSNLMVGCVIANPFAFNKSSLNTPPFQFTTGINFRIYEGLELLAELQKEGFSGLTTAMGINYQASLHLQLAVGVRTSGPQLSAGVLYVWSDKFSISMAMENHPQLGLSMNTGIDYFLFKK